MKSLLTTSFKDCHRRQWHSIRFAARIFWGRAIRVFRRPPLPLLPDARINLHLGCGSINHPAFINIDMAPLPHVHYIRPIDNLKIFRDRSVELIYACHCLEHYSHRDIANVLTEWYRVLKSNGRLRLSVPDFDCMVKIYAENDQNIDTVLNPLLGSHVNKYDIHKSAFTERSLRDQLTSAGFVAVTRWTPGSDELTSFNDWSARAISINGKDYNISLNLEAVK